MQTEFSHQNIVIQHIESVTLKNEMVIRLLTDWMTDQSGYDQMIWTSLKNSIQAFREEKILQIAIGKNMFFIFFR